MNKFKLGTHNSMSYLPVRKWYMNIYNFIAKCQSKSIEEQIKLGIEVVDIRVKKIDNSWVFAHGLVEYKGKLSDIFDVISSYNIVNNNKIKVRLILELLEENDRITEEFYILLSLLKHKYKNSLPLCDCRRKYDWELLKTPDVNINVIQYVSSMDYLFCKIKIHIPWLYAKIKNKKIFKKLNKEIHDESTVYLFDFL